MPTMALDIPVDRMAAVDRSRVRKVWFIHDEPLLNPGCEQIGAMLLPSMRRMGAEL
jgi:hypothetical protein